MSRPKTIQINQLDKIQLDTDGLYQKKSTQERHVYALLRGHQPIAALII